MNTFSKLVALALFATSAAIVSSAHPSSAQSAAGLAVPNDATRKQPCCRLATKPFFTGSAGWTVKPPNAAPTAAAVINAPNSAWSIVPGSKWIGNVANAGQTNQPGGTYIYTYHLGCLCGLPQGVSSVPASLTLKVYADDDVTVKLNGSVIGQHTGGYGFSNITNLTQISVDFQQMCDNILTFEVPNWDGVSTGPHTGGSANSSSSTARAARPQQIPLSLPVNPGSGPGSPTGLDVYGTVSGYFVDAPDDKRCPPCPQRGKIIDPR